MNENVKLNKTTINPANSTTNNAEAARPKRQVHLDSGITKAIEEMTINPEKSGEKEGEQMQVRPSQAGPEVGEAPAVAAKTNIASVNFIEKLERLNAGGLKGPIGIDIGSTHIAAAQKNCQNIKNVMQLNAFFAVPYSNIIKKTLLKDNINFFNKNNQIFILGSEAEKFATMNGAEIRRPVEKGLINPDEEDAIDVIKAIINSVISKPAQEGETICFNVPGGPIDRSTSLVFHESVIKMHLRNLGFSPISINEGHSVVIAELADNNFTGIGISIGGGMCNVCFSYLSVPVITFSIQKGGDYIDAMVAGAVGEPAYNIKAVKEEGLDLSAEPRNKIETGLHIFYDELFSTLLQSLQQALITSDKMPRISHAIPIVLSGGSVTPKGCREKFEKALDNVRLPIRISDVRIAEMPLYATANGSLKMAMEEGNI